MHYKIIVFITERERERERAEDMKKTPSKLHFQRDKFFLGERKPYLWLTTM